MIVKATASCFRVYDFVSCDLKSNINFFIGDNGAGKTAFLEILFVGLRGRSFRPFSKDYFIKNNKDIALIRLHLKKNTDVVVDVKFKKEGLKFKREVFINNKKRGFSYLQKEFPALVFKSEDLNIIRGSSLERRNFIDNLLVFNGSEKIIREFKNILREKTSLLRSYKKEECSKEEAKKTLKVLNEIFLKYSSQLLKERLSYLRDLEEDLKTVTSSLLPQDTRLGFKYFISSNEVLNTDQVLDFMKKTLEDKEDLELQVGVPLVGPQKHDILFTFNDKNSRVQCSQGQQRAFILSVLLREALSPKKPLLFLDDVLSELDEETQKKLLFFIEKTDCQTFITSCKKIVIKPKKGWFFEVKNGRIST